jgi:LPXTG-motif cell wall-anchored protein
LLNFVLKMLEQLNEFVSNNSTLVLIGLVAIVALIGFVLFRRSSSNSSVSTPVPTPSHDLEGMDNVNMVCDLANGVCMPPQHYPEQETMMAPENNSVMEMENTNTN